MRSMEEVQKDYTSQCALLGDAQYKLSVMEADIRAMKRRLKNINAEAKGIAAQQPQEEATDAQAE